MKVALRNSYVEFVFYMGVTSKYPEWFNKEMETALYTDENRYTFYLPLNERTPDYYDKVLVEDYSVFLRKPNGDIFVTNHEVFTELYDLFRYDGFTNSGIAGFKEDCIEYVECYEGVLPAGHPDWFYEFFTEALNLAPDNSDHEYILFYNNEFILKQDTYDTSMCGEVIISSHCVFLRNKFGEIRSMEYSNFIRHYEPSPIGGFGI